MRDFKLLKGYSKKLTHEMVTGVSWVPVELMGHESWSLERSIVIREWITDFYNGGCREEMIQNYFPEIDRTCIIMDWEVYLGPMGSNITATVRVCRTMGEYLEVTVTYVIE